MVSARNDFIKLTTDEEDLLKFVMQAEDFRSTAWEKYGADWIGHVPTNINAFVQYYFGKSLYPWQLAVYYCPAADATVHGGRGSGKTVGIGLAMASYHALHPGEEWLHVSPVKDQTQRTYDAIITNAGQVVGRPSFADRFISDVVTAPFPEIRLKRWSKADPGNILRFRPLGPTEDIERLRSIEAGTITVDEAFREVASPSTYPQLRGCIRGINQVRLSLLDERKQQDIEKRIRDISFMTAGKERKKAQHELDELLLKYGLNKRGMMLLYGNAGPHDWEWVRHDRARTDPQHYWSLTVTTWDNPALGEANIENMERSFDDPELRAVEMLGLRPMNLGNIFTAQNLKRCVDTELIPMCRTASQDGRPGYMLGEHPDYGVYLYQVPAIPGHMHVIGSDPGSGVAPSRNKWTILVYDVTEQPCRLVYFEMGYLTSRQAGDFTGFWQRMKLVGSLYPTAPGDIWIESSATQRGMTQLAFPEDVRVVPVELQTQKLSLINQLVQVFSKRVITIPELPQYMIEHGNYVLPDKDINQDIVMANICAIGALWRYIQLDYFIEPPDNMIHNDRHIALHLRRMTRLQGVRGRR